MLYTLMHKDREVARLRIDETGNILKVGKPIDEDLVPLQNRCNRNSIISWWNDRSVPVKQGRILKMLEDKGYNGTLDYLVANLGLSLTDCYWIKPIDSDLTFREINLFENDFHSNLLLGKIKEENDSIYKYSPHSTLQGNLEKSWVINNGERCLIKGNHTDWSSESINEVLIAEALKKQGKFPCVNYSLCTIKNKPYDYGCISKCFTSIESELVSAYALMTSEIKSNSVSQYEHLIRVAANSGLGDIREFLEYQILIDFAFSNTDRHLTNIAFLRDTESLQFTDIAPIFDNGKSMFVDKDSFILDKKRLLSFETNGFKNTEIDLLSLVQNRKLVDINKLPSPDRVTELYSMDSKMTNERIKFVTEAYKMKLDLLDKFQSGHDLKQLKFSARYNKPNSSSDIKIIEVF